MCGRTVGEEGWEGLPWGLPVFLGQHAGPYKVAVSQHRTHAGGTVGSYTPLLLTLHRQVLPQSPG